MPAGRRRSRSGAPGAGAVLRHALRAAQGLQGGQQRGQAALPWAAALEAGLYRRQGQGRRAGGQQVSHGAHLLGQGGGPGGWRRLLLF